MLIFVSFRPDGTISSTMLEEEELRPFFESLPDIIKGLLGL